MIEEFVAAGDFLTFKFPVWQWYVASGLQSMTNMLKVDYREKGEPSRARDFLPLDKQYLVTRNGEFFASEL